MKFVKSLLEASLIASSLAFPTWPEHTRGPILHPGHGGDSWGIQKAVYFLRVDPSGSNIVAIKVRNDGMLQEETSVTSTHGVGQQSQNASTSDLAPVAIDPLQGQQAVSIGDNYLFTINSGSDTVVMFEIDPVDPLKLRMIGQPMPTLGEFAMSVAYSTKYQKGKPVTHQKLDTILLTPPVCVLNGGALNGVTCYNADRDKGLIPDGVGLREFGFAATTPAQLGGAKGSGSDIQFSGDSSKVITTFKGESKPETTLGHISVFSVDEAGNVGKTATDNRVSPLSGAFGFALNGDDLQQMYVTGVGFGGVLVSLDYNTDKISALAVVNNTKFGASCWATWSSATKKYYDISAAAPNVGIVESSGDLTGFITYNDSLAGGVDAVVDGKMMYMMTASNNIAVFDLDGGNVLQAFEYSTMLDRPHWTGLAMWPAKRILSGGI